MRVADNQALRIKLLRRGKVIACGVDEKTRLQIFDGHDDSECSVCGDGVHVLRVLELGRWHQGVRRDLAHDHRVARSCFDLQTIGERQVCCSAEIDEVVAGRE